MTEDEDTGGGDNALNLPGLESVTIAPAIGVGAIALNMSLKYHDINMVKDGALYQQYKLEGRNFRDLHLDVVFETAERIEQHLMGTANRLSEVVYGTLIDALASEEDLGEEAEGTEAAGQLRDEPE